MAALIRFSKICGRKMEFVREIQTRFEWKGIFRRFSRANDDDFFFRVVSRTKWKNKNNFNVMLLFVCVFFSVLGH